MLKPTSHQLNHIRTPNQVFFLWLLLLHIFTNTYKATVQLYIKSLVWTKLTLHHTSSTLYSGGGPQRKEPHILSHYFQEVSVLTWQLFWHKMISVRCVHPRLWVCFPDILVTWLAVACWTLASFTHTGAWLCSRGFVMAHNSFTLRMLWIDEFYSRVVSQFLPTARPAWQDISCLYGTEALTTGYRPGWLSPLYDFMTHRRHLINDTTAWVYQSQAV